MKKELQIKIKPITSSTINGVGYDEASKTLAVDFQRTGIYHYLDVPLPVFKELEASTSIGSFIMQKIGPKYKYTKIGKYGE
jgi:hypothetical protein